jgi:hypothetical protein
MNDDPRDNPPANSSPDERFEILWTDYLEGVLDAAGMAELDALLAADKQLVARAADLYQTHRRLGLLVTERRDAAASATDFVADVMGRLPADGETITRRVMDRLAAGTRPAGSAPRRQASWRGVAAALLAGGGVLAALALMFIATKAPPPTAAEPVRFASLARARFLGRETPARQTEAVRGETYVLSAGAVELAFPIGATAIVEGPAVFRVCGSDCLAVDAGRCSVHAPKGAEGFRVDTPVTRVIDRGTRFVVRVGETADTEVQVIEGAADLFAKDTPASAPLSLAAGGAARIDPAVDRGRIAVVAAADPSTVYTRRLPDRLISYSASLRHPASAVDPAAGDDTDGIDTLEGVTVQRDGRVVTYRAEQLIGVTVVHFRAGANQQNLVAPVAAEWSADRTAGEAARRSVLETDRLLTSGMINPGGSRTPPSSAPLLDAAGHDEAPPGIAVRFARPVVNEPGPDVIFFELQMLSDPPQGDAFHVGPLEAGAGLRWHTVADYDIDSTSPESQLLARFRLFGFPGRAASLADLLSMQTRGGHVLPVRAKGNAVGIDLATLGYAEGAVCNGLFFQDADDDTTTIDPTFIAGLPALEGRAEAAPVTEAIR